MDATAIDAGTQLVGAGGIAIALTSIVRDAWPEIPSRFVPMIAVALGVGISLLFAAGDGPLTINDGLAAIAAGVGSVGAREAGVRTVRPRPPS